MTQYIIALLIIIFIASRQIMMRRRGQLPGTEFYFWMIFWGVAALAVVFLKQIDAFVASLGFSSSGISVLLYLAVIILFHLVFRLRLRLGKTEREISELVRRMAIQDSEEVNFPEK